MSSRDSEGESYVADYLADPKVYGDLEHCGWTTEGEEYYDPKGKEETSSDEDEVPLPQPGDMHLEFKSQASLIEQRNLRSSSSLFVSCRRTNRNYAKGY